MDERERKSSLKPVTEGQTIENMQKTGGDNGNEQ